jgi:hypothetical protein
MEDKIELTKEELQIAEIISKLFQNNVITIEVSIEPEYAEKGDGRWNVTKTNVTILDNTFEFRGHVEIINTI